MLFAFLLCVIADENLMARILHGELSWSTSFFLIEMYRNVLRETRKSS